MTSTICSNELGECMPALQRFAMSLTRNEDRAHDLVQDSVERALRKQHLFDGSNLRSWLFTICRRVFLNQIRKEKSRGHAVPVEDAPQSALSISQSQEVTMHFNDVLGAFKELPLNDKVVLSLIVVEGLKYEEVAEILDIPIGTVRSRLSRARSRLDGMIAFEENDKGTRSAAFV